MHLLYLDDSGSVGNASEQYLVLGGLSVFEAQSYWITQQLDTLAEGVNAGDPHSVEFHASETLAIVHLTKVAVGRILAGTEPLILA